MKGILNKDTYASSDERAALYSYLKLDNTFIQTLEHGIENELLTINLHPRKKTPFSNTLDDILKRLKPAGFDTTQLGERSRDKITGEIRISTSNLHIWRTGGNYPALDKLRILVETLESVAKIDPKGTLNPDDIQKLISYSGFKETDLSDTSHSHIARSDENSTHIGILLGNIRNVADISIGLEKVASMLPVTVDTTTVSSWEKSDRYVPTTKQVRELLDVHNRILASKGK